MFEVDKSQLDPDDDRHNDNDETPGVVWVNAYRISRHFGGPEEGGWWYDWYTCVASMPITNGLPDTEQRCALIGIWMAESLGWTPTPYEMNHGGSRFVVNGHSDFAVYTEKSYQESETTHRPHYE